MLLLRGVFVARLLICGDGQAGAAGERRMMKLDPDDDKAGTMDATSAGRFTAGIAAQVIFNPPPLIRILSL